MKIMRAVITICAFFIASYATAQSCFDGYPREDRERVIRETAEKTYLFTRMAELAEQSAMGVFPIEQREALNNEFIALRNYLDFDLSPINSNLQPRSVEFLNAIYDLTFLELDNATVNGSSIADAQVNARKALDAVNDARATVEICAHVSFDRIDLTGPSYDGRCGIFNESEWRPVALRYSEAHRILTDLKELSTQSASGVYSTSQRKSLQGSFDFAREDMVALSLPIKGISSRTNKYIQRIFNPVFLGLDTLSITGDTIADAQMNARLTLEEVEDTADFIKSCIFTTPRKSYPYGKK